MTQVIAMRCNEGLVLAADTCVLSGPPGGPFTKGAPEHKAFEIAGRFGVLAYGSGPPEHVPSVIESMTAERSASAMASALLKRFGGHYPRPAMHLLLAGMEGTRLVLLDVHVSTDDYQELMDLVVCRGMINAPSDLPGWAYRDDSERDCDHVIVEAERLIIGTAMKHPDCVSGPIEAVLVSASGARTLR